MKFGGTTLEDPNPKLLLSYPHGNKMKDYGLCTLIRPYIIFF